MDRTSILDVAEALRASAAAEDLRPLRESEVSPAMRTWAKAIRADATTYPLGSVTTIEPGVVARVEIHTWIGATGEQRPDGIRGVSLYHVGPHVDAPPPHATLAEGIDVSGFQRGADLAKPAAAGARFVYAKATEGIQLADKAFAEHWQRAGDAGMLRGAYHFLRASRSSSDQVAHFLEVVAAVEAQHGRAELPPCLDVEVDDHTDLATCAAAVARAVEALAAAGRRPLLYTMPGWWDGLPAAPLAHVAELADLWVAHWQVPAPRIPRGWSRWAFWQYSASANVPGVGPRMDVDRFIGSPDELAAWAAGGALPAPRVPILAVDTLMGVQAALFALGYRPITIDGIDGGETRAAVSAFQRAHRLVVDGAAGPATKAALRAAVGG